MNRLQTRTRRRRDKSHRVGTPSFVDIDQVKNPYQPISVLSADQVEKIHQSSLKVLAETGVSFLLPKALDILHQAGADVDFKSQIVKFDPELVISHVKNAPSEFVLHARNSDNNQIIGGNNICFGTVASAPNVSDSEFGRRPGNYKDYCDLVRLAQVIPAIKLISGYPVEPIDLPVNIRHLDALKFIVEHCDKAFHAYSLGKERIRDGIEIARIARGVDMEQLRREPSLISIINSSSPLRIDIPMLEGIIELAKARQVMVLTPFTLSGAMAPATIGGALVMQNAEALAGIAFAQMINPGTPCVYGGFTSNVDMKTGAPAFGTPEYSKAALAGGQLARFYNLPYRSSNATASNAVDAQCAYEAQMSLWGAVMGHANIVLHGAGWLEGGLCASFEKMILDAELLQMMAKFTEPLDVSDQAIGLDAIKEVGHGGHFFGTAHTLERYETAFYAPLISDWSNFETWQERGSQTATQRAHTLYKDLLKNYETPSLDSATKEELEAFVQKRHEEGGAPPL